MLQDIFPHTFSNVYEPYTEMLETDYVFYFNGDALLLKKRDEVFSLPIKSDLSSTTMDGVFLFKLNGHSCWLAEHLECPEGVGYEYVEISYFRNIEQKDVEWTSIVAFQLNTWYTQHKFCGVCGSRNVPKSDERALECPSCGHVKFPTISPAIIVAILCGDKLLLARNAMFRDEMYSLVAGYVDVGESIEDCVVREVREEVGIEIKNIRYYKSQPWPYSSSMMIGFVAEAEAGQTIEIDNKEIIAADWFTKDKLPNCPPARSIAGEMIDQFVGGTL